MNLALLGAIEISVTPAHFVALLPVLILAAFGLVILLLDTFQRSNVRDHLAHLALVGFVAAGVAAYYLWHDEAARPLFHEMVYLDGFAQAFAALFAVAGGLTCMLARPYLVSHGRNLGEFYVLVLFAVAGMMLVAASANLMTLFLGIETMSIASYVLASFMRHDKRSAEAGMKYLILGALSTGLLLYGIALIYGATGTVDLDDIGAVYAGEPAAVGNDEILSFGSLHEAGAISEGRWEGIMGAFAEGDVYGAFRQMDRSSGVASVPAEARVATLGPAPGQFYELQPLAFMGMLLVLVALLFKVGAAPFHMWTPDVYTGSASPVVGFMGSAVKAAAFAAILRVFLTAFFEDPARNTSTGWVQVAFVIALVSMVFGNAAAIVQDNIKRMLAYSSVAHAGYILVGLTAAGYAQSQALSNSVIFYLIAYTFGTVGAFGVLSLLGRKGHEVTRYDHLDGLASRHPWLAAAMSLFMLSAAGIPGTAGFLAKFYVFKAAVDASGTHGPAPQLMIILAVVGILASVAGVYYYLKVMVHMYMKPVAREHQPLTSRAGAWALAICAAATVYIGVLPNQPTYLATQAAIRIADSPEGPRAFDFGVRRGGAAEVLELERLDAMRIEDLLPAE
jgi:NADH-quinone oxidoreductase subunit N